MKNTKLYIKSAFAMILLTTSITAHATSMQPATNDKSITFDAPTLYPESVTWSTTNQRFYVSSVLHGTVGTVDLKGHYSSFIKDKQFVSTIGLRIDPKHNTLWVVNGDFGVSTASKPNTLSQIAGVGKYDATTGKTIAYYDLKALTSGPVLLNDLAVDNEGNAYVTDCYASKIYKIDSKGHSSIFANDPRFKPEKGFNLNGIVFNSEGYLLVGKHNTGEIFKINIRNPKDVTEVKLPKKLLGLDGITFVDNKHIVGVLNLVNHEAVELKSDDNWKTASISREVETTYALPSAVTVANHKIYVLNGRLDTLSNPQSRVNSFLLQNF